MTSLRTKFIVFIGVIIVVVCSGLSWYVVTEQVEFMADALRKTGLVIVKNLAAHCQRHGFVGTSHRWCHED